MFSFIKNFFASIFNFFKSNLVLLQIGVQEAANAVFKSRPQLKVPVLQAISDIEAIIAQTPAIALSDAIALAKSKIMANLPPDQKIILGTAVDQLFSNLVNDINDYLVKQNVNTQSSQVKVLLQVLGWVGAMAQL